ncbi:MAG: acyl-CoA dehydrogenase family protein [Aliidongia sp.]
MRRVPSAATMWRRARPEWERQRVLPREALHAAAAIGLTGIEVPRDQGGQGAGFPAKLLIAEELARACMGFAFALINTQNVAAHIAVSGTQEQIARYVAPLLAGEITACTALTEPHAGSDFPAITTLARRTETGWIIDGGEGLGDQCRDRRSGGRLCQDRPGARHRGCRGLPGRRPQPRLRAAAGLWADGRPRDRRRRLPPERLSGCG